MTGLRNFISLVGNHDWMWGVAQRRRKEEGFGVLQGERSMFSGVLILRIFWGCRHSWDSHTEGVSIINGAFS